MDDFEGYVRARSAALGRTAYLLTGDVHHAEDLLQDTLARVADRWPTIVRKGDPEPYVQKVMYNRAVVVPDNLHPIGWAGSTPFLATYPEHASGRLAALVGFPVETMVVTDPRLDAGYLALAAEPRQASRAAGRGVRRPTPGAGGGARHSPAPSSRPWGC